LFNGPIVVVRLALLIRKLAPDIIQSWLYYGDLIATLALYLSGRRRQTRLYWGIRASDISRRFNWRSRLIVALCVRLSSLPDAAIANSHAGARDHRRIGYRTPAFAVIPNGIDTGKFKPDDAKRAPMRSELGIGENAIFVIHVGRVSEMKDHATFFAVAEALPDLAFAAIGRGTESLRMPANVRRLGLCEDMPAIYAAADYLISTSLFGEGFPNVVAEAMACGVPVVATDVGDGREIIGDTGMVVPPSSPAAIVEALLRLTRENAAQRQERARLCRERIATRFPIERMVARFDALYTGGLEALDAPRDAGS
jgi:glycosyltransferase involved in cell wall biosynthesis